MSDQLVLSLGTNLGDKIKNLYEAKSHIATKLKIVEESRLYHSKAVDYLNQPDFLNQVICYEIPHITPTTCLEFTQEIEVLMGRKKEIPKGPRVIDIDLLFWGTQKIKTENLTIPHPHLFQRSFIVLPLAETKYFDTLSHCFDFPKTFSNEAFPLKDSCLLPD